MRRVVALFGALTLALAVFVPAAFAAEPAMLNTGRVLISIEGDVTLPVGQHADAVIVVGGTGTIRGEVNTVVAIDGMAVLDGARAETIVAIRSPVTLTGGAVVTGDVLTLESAINKVGNVQIGGEVRDITAGLVGFGLVFAGALVLWFIGLGIAAILAGLLLAALATRQVREAEAIISREPVRAFVAGLLGLVGIGLVGVLAIITIIGAPIGFGLLGAVLPFLSMLGFLVTGIFIGEWIVRQLQPGTVHERPYLAALVGILLMVVLSIVPFVSGIATLFGVGALLILAWRTYRGPVTPEVAAPIGAPVPMPG
jgi:hypothetical protein